MPIDSTIDIKTGITIYTATGEIRFEEIRTSFEESLELSGYENVFPVIWDIRNANLLKINEEDFSQISDYYESQLENSTLVKSAFVVSDALELGLFKLFEAYMVKLPLEIMAFRSFEEAVEWVKE